MVTYEFECAKCHHRFAVAQSFAQHDRNLKPKCPQCGSRKVGQLISAVHVKTRKKS